MADLRHKFDWQRRYRGWIWVQKLIIFTSDNLFCSNSSPTLELSVKFESQICHENINKPIDGTYLADFGIDIIPNQSHGKKVNDKNRLNFSSPEVSKTFWAASSLYKFSIKRPDKKDFSTSHEKNNFWYCKII